MKDQYYNELYHYGVLGMKWGKRKAKRYESRSKRYRYDADEETRRAKEFESEARSYERAAKTSSAGKAKRLTKMARQAREDRDIYRESAETSKALADKYSSKAKKQHEKLQASKYTKSKESVNSDKTKTYAKAGAATAGVLLAAYGAYKVAKRVGSNAAILDASGKVLTRFKM